MNTFEVGLKRIGNWYLKNKPKILKAGIFIGTATIAGVSIAEAEPLKKAIKDAVHEYKEAESGKDKAAAVLDGGVKIGKHAAPIAAAVIFTDACAHGMYKEMDNRIGIALGLVAASQSELIDLKGTVKEVVGKKKALEIEEKTAEKQYERFREEDPAMFDDDDSDNPDVFFDPVSGAKFRGKYLEVLNAINSTFNKVRIGGEPVTYTYLIDQINANKSGELIRPRAMTEYFIFDPMDAQECGDEVQDFMKIVQAGPNRYKLVIGVDLQANPKYFSKKLKASDVKYMDALAGDGVWHAGKYVLGKD